MIGNLKSVSINKLLLKHSHTHCLHIICGCFAPTKSRMSSYSRGPEIFTNWPFTEKSADSWAESPTPLMCQESFPLHSS